MKSNAPLSPLNLVKLYFNICNAALVQNRERPVYGSLIRLIDQFVAGRTISVSVESAGEVQAGPYTVKFGNGEFSPVRKGEHEPDLTVVLRREFLEGVVEHADEYIAHPERLEWAWLQERSAADKA